MKPIHLTNQDLFSAAWEQAKLKTKSTDGGGFCVYRGQNGAKCFIGAAIPDERYDPSMENRAAFSALKEASMTVDDGGLTGELQDIHDCHGVDNWDKLLRYLAQIYSLTIPGETK